VAWQGVCGMAAGGCSVNALVPLPSWCGNYYLSLFYIKFTTECLVSITIAKASLPGTKVMYSSFIMDHFKKSNNIRTIFKIICF
jgi:hypothetical protein